MAYQFVRSLALAATMTLFCGAICPANVSVDQAWATDQRVTLSGGGIALVFRADDGRIAVTDAQSEETFGGVLIMGPYQAANHVTRVHVTSTGPERAEAEVDFSAGPDSLRAVVGIDANGDVHFSPVDSIDYVRLEIPFRYGVLPTRHLDDNIMEAKNHPEARRLSVPPEGMLLGLGRDGEQMVTLLWDRRGPQRVALVPDVVQDDGAEQLFQSMEIRPEGQPFHFSIVSEPGLWFEMETDPANVGRDIELPWTPPFEAAWHAQFEEDGVLTKYPFRSFKAGKKRTFWRPGYGHYEYPLWFIDDKPVLRVPKVVQPPDQRLLIYALEGNEKTPYAFMLRTLDADALAGVTDLKGARTTYSLLPSPDPSVWNNACRGRTACLKGILPVGAQAGDFLITHMEDRSYISGSAEVRNRRYMAFFDEWDGRLAQWRSDAADDEARVAYVDKLKGLLDGAREELAGRMEGMTADERLERLNGWVEHAQRLALETGPEPSREAAAEVTEYLTRVNDVINDQHKSSRYVGARMRLLAHEAGRLCVDCEEQADMAAEIREAIKTELTIRDRETILSSRQKSLLEAAEAVADEGEDE